MPKTDDIGSADWTALFDSAEDGGSCTEYRVESASTNTTDMQIRVTPIHTKADRKVDQLAPGNSVTYSAGFQAVTKVEAKMVSGTGSAYHAVVTDKSYRND